MVARALADTSHPVLAQIIPMRFCNLSCAYCNEYDKVSPPVPLEEMYRRIDHLGRLGTAMIGISGGEPLTHPDLDDIIRRMRNTGAIAGMITNGYLLNQERIERLNAAGLDHMQIRDRKYPPAVVLWPGEFPFASGHFMASEETPAWLWHMPLKGV